MATYTVTIRECRTNGFIKTTRVRAADEADARIRGVSKLYGSRRGFWQDSGLPAGFGQIIEPARTGGSNCVTGRVRIDVE